MENHLVEEVAPLVGGFPFTADEEGYLTLHTPRWGGNNQIPFISIIEDYGDLVHGVFLAPEKYNGRLIQGISASETPETLVSVFEKSTTTLSCSCPRNPLTVATIVTGQKARFVPIEDWKTMETYGEKSFETVKYMFGFCQHSGGLYYGVPNDLVTSGELKAKAAEAKGESVDKADLTSLEGFVTKYFAS